MTRSPVSPLNKALYARLKSRLTVPVCDFVPVGRKAPYLALTDTQAQDWKTKTVSGASVTATVKVISEYQGDKEVAELADEAINAIANPVLALENDWQIVTVGIDSHSVERFDTHREAAITFRFTIIDTREG